MNENEKWQKRNALKILRTKKWKFFLSNGLILGVLNFLFVNRLDLGHKTWKEAYFSLSGLYEFIGGFVIGLLILSPILWWYSGYVVRRIERKGTTQKTNNKL